MPKPYLLAETNWKQVQATSYDLAVLPWGATEAHNFHLPYATDNYQNEFVAEAAAHIAWDAGAKVIILPNIPFGINTGQLDIPLCINMNPETQMQVLRDVADSVLRAGIRKLVIFNGHGGNHFKLMVRDLSFHFPSLFTCAINWFDGGKKWEEYFEDLGDHAGELETSTMLHIAPRLVMPLDTAGDGAVKKWKIPAMNDGWITSQRQWTKVSADTGVGNPAQATAAKGQQFLEDCARGIANFWIDLAAVEVDDMYV